MFKAGRATKGIATVLRAFIVSVCVLGASGCRTYNQEWKDAGKTLTSGGFEGRWEGTWHSDQNGHSGKLRCITIRRYENEYDAKFRATYQKILRFSHTAPLYTQSQGTNWVFSGEANLGWWAGGLYRYEGRADAWSFFSTYSNRYDHGTFVMERK